MAADACQAEAVSVLLEAGADVNPLSLGGLTPLHLACRNNCLAAVLALLQSPDLDPDVETNERTTPEMLTRDAQILKAIESYRSDKSVLG